MSGKKSKDDDSKKHKKAKKRAKAVAHCPHCGNHCQLIAPKCKKGVREAKKRGIRAR
jgi:hypothetical protein